VRVRGPFVGKNSTDLQRVRASCARSRGPQRRARSLCRRALCALTLVSLSWIGSSAGVAEEVSKEQMRGLDEQVQEIKSDVLRIAAELSLLEEKLLYPSNTQVAVFVSLGEGESFRLDSVGILIDGEPVARHVYSFKELEALQKGGVQRIYTGNVATGEHRLEVSVAGKLPGGKDWSGAETFPLSKEVEPKLVGISLAAQDSGSVRIQLGDW
jgi:hypothetical protein